MRKTRNLLETVRRPSIKAQTSGRSSFIRNLARRILAEHETSRQRNFIPKPTAADALPMRFRRSKQLQIPRRRTQIKLPAVFVTHLSPEKRSPLVSMQVKGRFWAKEQGRRRSTDN